MLSHTYSARYIKKLVGGWEGEHLIEGGEGGRGEGEYWEKGEHLKCKCIKYSIKKSKKKKKKKLYCPPFSGLFQVSFRIQDISFCV